MDVTIIGCPCLRGKRNRLRDMLIAEGFNVRIQSVRKPGHLRLIANGQSIWSWRLFRKIPLQRELAQQVRAAFGA